MRIGLLPNPQKDQGLKKTKDIAKEIISLGGTPIISLKYKKYFEDKTENIKIMEYDDCDMLICLGGDGTFLTAVHEYLSKDIPIIGVNMGSLGFLAEIDQNKTKEALEAIFAGKYKIEKRILLEGSCYSHNGKKKVTTVCLNDFVVSRGSVSRILNLELYIDQTPLENIPGDGVIISSPTGSTAYALSAGGPIIQPDLDMILITPLNPHTLHNRSYVVSSKSTVKIVIKEYPFNPSLTSDGEEVCVLENEDVIHITKSNKYMSLIKLSDKNFYESLSTKIYARGLKSN